MPVAGSRIKDPLLAVVEAMTPEAQQVALDSHAAMNPHHKGANLDDALEMHESHDSFLWFREPFWEQYGERYDRRLRPYISAASIAVALILGSSEEPNPLTALTVDLLGRRAAELDGVVFNAG